MRTTSMISRRSTAALRYIRPTTFRVVSISNTISSMGEKPVDIAKLKEEKKRKKEEQKKLSQANKQQKQLPPPKPIQRSFCAIPGNAPLPDAVGTLTAMSFNILGQCLIKRQLFPDSGEMLKWKLRRTMVAQEMAMYNPDILCMQEMDNFDTFYKGELEKLGYKTELFQHPKKKHGIAIAYKSDLFTVVGYKTVDYDTDPLCPPTWKTGNIGQFLALQHNQHPQYGFVVGNTHLYWRPTAVYERVRQSMIYLRRLLELKNKVQEKIPGTQWIPFAIGDFNTTPDDPGYALLNNKSISEKDIEGLELSRKSPGSYMTVTSSSNNNNQEGGGSNGGETSIPQPPPPEAQEGGDEEIIGEAAAMTMPTSDLLQQLEQDRVGWQSVYSCYNEIDPAEADPEFGEPKFSNYTVSFKGTLDYMLLRPGLDPIMATELLKMPPQSLMEPSLPNRNFGSDHVCIATKIQFGGKKQQ